MADRERSRGRPASAERKVELNLKIPRGLRAYLREAAATHLCGGQTVTEAAIFLLNEGINRLIEQGKIGPQRRFLHYDAPAPEDEKEG